MDINMVGSGLNTNVQVQVDPSFQALRTSIRPLETAPQNGVAGGHYSIGAQSGLMASGIASAAQVFQVRWADPTKLFLLKRLSIQASTCTGFAATTIGAPLELIVGHGSTANGSSGTALAPTSLGNKMRTAMATTSFATLGEIRISTTAALTAATGQTLEPAPVAGCMGAPNATLAQSPLMNLFEQRDAGDHPLILGMGDTLAIRTNTPAATGTWTFYVSMVWAEAVSF